MKEQVLGTPKGIFKALQAIGEAPEDPKGLPCPECGIKTFEVCGGGLLFCLLCGIFWKEKEAS